MSRRRYPPNENHTAEGAALFRPTGFEHVPLISWRITTVRRAPRSHRGYAYKLAGRTEDARREFTLALDPKHIKARYNLEYPDEAPHR